MAVFDLRKDFLFVKGTLEGEWHPNEVLETLLGPMKGHYSPWGPGKGARGVELEGAKCQHIKVQGSKDAILSLKDLI